MTQETSTVSGETPVGIVNESEGSLDEELFFEEQICACILGCIDHMEGRFGRLKVAGVLTGTTSQFVFDHGFNICPYYGTLDMFTQSEVVEMIDWMINEGFSSFTGENYPVVSITPIGQAVLKNEGRGVHVALPWTIEPRPLPTPVNNELFDSLRDLRYKLAKEEELPSYCIFNNRTLLELSERMPKTNEDLLEIYGISDHKAERYGKVLLQIINKVEEPSGSSTPDGFTRSDLIDEDKQLFDAVAEGFM